jgi:hypothetical protein
MPTWKRLAVISFSAGTGFAVVFSLILGGWVWYQSQPKPWDEKAIAATYSNCVLSGEKGSEFPMFFYRLENRTNYDYEVQSNSGFQYFLNEGKSLSPAWLGIMEIQDWPLSIPAKQTVFVGLKFKFVAKDQPINDTKDEIEKFIKNPTQIWNEYEGFVAFDKNHHYKIVFPKGW